jgi:hypothetical protein
MNVPPTKRPVSVDFIGILASKRPWLVGGFAIFIAFGLFDVVSRRRVVTTSKGHTFVVWRKRFLETWSRPTGCIIFEYTVDSLDEAGATGAAEELMPILADDVKAAGIDCLEIRGTGSTNTLSGLTAHVSTFHSTFIHRADGSWKEPMGSVGIR